MRERLLAIDWMRGFVMVLMTVDHASLMFNSGRIAIDSAYLFDPATGVGHVPGTGLPAAQFFTRWVTHLCAPTFLFLSGTSLALSLEKRRALDMSEAELDRHLFIRGAVVLACEGLLSLMAGQGIVLLQVLYAIGLSLWLMIPLRRVGTGWLIGLGLGWFAFGELITTGLVPIGSRDIPFLLRLLFAPEFASPVTVVYPVAGWLAMMALGWSFGRHLLLMPEDGRRAERAARLTARLGLAALGVFLVVRGIDGYGNLGLHRDDTSLIQWLHVSKYPPCLAFAALELGLMGVLLAFFSAVESRLPGPGSRWNPLRVFGQAALLYYMLHFVGLGAGAAILGGGLQHYGLRETYLAAILAMLVLYPVCIGWRRYKSSHPGGWAQYL